MCFKKKLQLDHVVFYSLLSLKIKKVQDTPQYFEPFFYDFMILCVLQKGKKLVSDSSQLLETVSKRHFTPVHITCPFKLRCANGLAICEIEFAVA
jgi:hypothetical protein